MSYQIKEQKRGKTAKALKAKVIVCVGPQGEGARETPDSELTRTKISLGTGNEITVFIRDSRSAICNVGRGRPKWNETDLDYGMPRGRISIEKPLKTFIEGLSSVVDLGGVPDRTRVRVRRGNLYDDAIRIAGDMSRAVLLFPNCFQDEESDDQEPRKAKREARAKFKAEKRRLRRKLIQR